MGYLDGKNSYIGAPNHTKHIYMYIICGPKRPPLKRASRRISSVPRTRIHVHVLRKFLPQITLPRGGKSGHRGSALQARFLGGLARNHTQVTHTPSREAPGRRAILVTLVTPGARSGSQLGSHSPPPALRWLRPWQRGTSRQPATAAAGATATAPRRTGPCSCRQWLNVKGNTKLTHVAGAGPAAGCQPVSGSGGGRVASATLDLRWTEPPPSGGRAADELTYREPLADVTGNGSGQSVACVAVPRSCITADSGRHCRHVDIQPQSACWRARGTQPRRRDGVVRPPSG